MKRLTGTVLALALSSSSAFAQDSFKLCWSIYVGWMPWGYAADQGIVKKWADKYGIEIEVVQINDYIESINQYTAGEFDACTMTNMDALTIPAASSVDSTALIVGDFSNGNDGIVLKGSDSLEAIKGRDVNLVELSVSHYLLARALDSIGSNETELTVVNTSDADLVAVYSNPDVSATVTWNPLLSEVLSMPDSHLVFDSSKIPGEIIDLTVAKTEVLAEHPEFGKALVGAWYETMALINSEGAEAEAAREAMGQASGTDRAGYEAQLDSTEMFYTPAAALELTESGTLLQTMQNVAEFSFDHGLLGEGAPDAESVGIEMPAGVYGNSDNVQLRFDPSYMQMAADGEL